MLVEFHQKLILSLSLKIEQKSHRLEFSDAISFFQFTVVTPRLRVHELAVDLTSERDDLLVGRLRDPLRTECQAPFRCAMAWPWRASASLGSRMRNEKRTCVVAAVMVTRATASPTGTASARPCPAFDVDRNVLGELRETGVGTLHWTGRRQRHGGTALRHRLRQPNR